MAQLFISEENLGPEATKEQAEDLVALLKAEKGWPVDYGSSIDNDWGNWAEIVKEIFEADFYELLPRVA